MKNHWDDFFVIESVEEVVKVFRRHGLKVDYDEKVNPQEHARGFVEKGFGGMIMSSRIWRKGMRAESRSCIEIPKGFKDFKKIRKIITNDLRIV